MTPLRNAHPDLPWEERLLSFHALSRRRALWRQEGKTVVATNGCFDLLHLGHLVYLERASQLGDLLVVGLNSDASVRAIKGPSRPINPEMDRACALAALRSVDAVCVFHEKDALAFLEIASPDVYVKGGDYTLESINQEERGLIESSGGSIQIVTGVPDRSTSSLLRRIDSSPHR